MSDSALATLLPSAPNFRDLGGLRTSSGRTVRSGLLFRSEALDKLSPSDQRKLTAFNIHTLCDLRGEKERLQSPNCWPTTTNVCCLDFNIEADVRGADQSVIALLGNNPSAADAHQVMLSTYQLFPKAFERALPRIVNAITDQQLSMVFHCSAGKDRTGFVAAILLRALDVPWPQVYANYLHSNALWAGARARQSIRGVLELICKGPLEDAFIQTLCTVSTDYLQAAFSVIDRDYGGLDAYLAHIGIDHNQREQLAKLCLEP